MKLSKKAVTIIDAQVYRAYGMGYSDAIRDMAAWLNVDLPGVVNSVLERKAAEIGRTLHECEAGNYRAINDSAREHVELTHVALGLEDA